MEVERAHSIVLKLDEEERQWLHSVMQNPLWGQHPFDEDPVDRHHRKVFFDATEEQP